MGSVTITSNTAKAKGSHGQVILKSLIFVIFISSCWRHIIPRQDLAVNCVYLHLIPGFRFTLPHTVLPQSLSLDGRGLGR